MVRKEGKMPGELLTATASIEYGAAQLTLNPKGLAGFDVLVVDDVLATGERPVRSPGCWPRRARRAYASRSSWS